MSSGWVRTAVAEIVLEYHGVAQDFLKSYWKKKRYIKAPSREAALKAISCLCGDHRKHWLTAANKIARLYKDKPKPKEPDHKFAVRATVWYLETQANRCVDCLDVDTLEALAKGVFGHPRKTSSYIVDCAAALIFATSHSTIIHVRAEMKSRGRALVAMKSDDELQLKASRR